MKPSTEKFWALVDQLTEARKQGKITLIEAVEEAYPADDAVEVIFGTIKDSVEKKTLEAALKGVECSCSDSVMSYSAPDQQRTPSLGAESSATTARPAHARGHRRISGNVHANRKRSSLSKSKAVLNESGKASSGVIERMGKRLLKLRMAYAALFRTQPRFTFQVVGDSYLRPVIDAAMESVNRDGEARIQYFFGNGIGETFDAVLVCDGSRVPQTPKPWQRVQLKNKPWPLAVRRLVDAIKVCMDAADGAP